MWVGAGVGVSMHLLVLSAFRLETVERPQVASQSQCTFWCSVLSDRRSQRLPAAASCLNAPFGAQCFPTLSPRWMSRGFVVSMHLLVLSAFRPVKYVAFGRRSARVSMHLLVLSAFRHTPEQGAGIVQSSLNAPFGAQCFPTCHACGCSEPASVSMHLLVLSAFRR